MGICISTMKKRKDPPSPSSSSSSSSSSSPPPPSTVAKPSPSPAPAPTGPPPVPAPIPIPHDPDTDQPKDPPPPSHPQKPQTSKPEDTPNKKPLFLITPSKAHKPTSPEALASPSSAAVVNPSPLDDPPPIAPTRTSSCTKEEVESILIQCSRVSRSSSSNSRRYSGSKRSFDFDSERRVEGGEDWERSLHQPSSSCPSPRRRAHSRERDGGGWQMSRSPGRRAEQPVASGGPRQQQQPGKMVSVPARERGSSNNGSSAESGGIGARNQWSSGHGSNGPVRSSSPRSRSPGIVRVVANENYYHVLSGGGNNSGDDGNNNGGHQQPLSRSSSRKAEQSPYRRNLMEEIDENCVRGEQQPVGDQGLKKKKKKGSVTQTLPERTKSEHREEPNSPGKGTREQPKSCRPEEDVLQRRQQEISDKQEQPAPPIEAKAINITRSRSSHRSSRDLDVILSNTPASTSSYASLLLEDIHNYHQQNSASAAAPFSLPTCVSKACSILEAVADLNNDGFSSSGQGSSQKQSFPEPKVEQSLHMYVSVRKKVVVVETEPQESAGSNRFVGQQQWAAGNCKGNTAESPSDRCWMSSSWSGQEEEVEGGGE